MKIIHNSNTTLAATVVTLHLQLAPLVNASLVIHLDNKSFRQAAQMWVKDPTTARVVYGDIKEWDVSSVSDMSSAFNNATEFNEDVSQWDVGKVKNVSHMFHGASTFDCNLSMWNTNHVFDFSYMFANASSFNGDVSTWSVANAYDLSHMFEHAISFDGDLSKWMRRRNNNIDEGSSSSSVSVQDEINFQVKWAQNLNSMFRGATSFQGRGGLSSWETYAVLNMASMFQDCIRFDSSKSSANNISSWNVNLVRNFEYMFDGSSFHHHLCWDDVHPTAKTTNMFRNTPPPGGSLNDFEVCGNTDSYGDDSNNDIAPFGDLFEKYEQDPNDKASNAASSLSNLQLVLWSGCALAEFTKWAFNQDDKLLSL